MTAACQAPLFSTVAQSLCKFMSIEWLSLQIAELLCNWLLFWCACGRK